MKQIYVTMFILSFCCSCSPQGKEVTRKEFEFIILVRDAKKVWYNAAQNKACLALRESVLQNQRYKADLPDEDRFDEPQYYLKIDSKEEYEALMDSLVAKLPPEYLTKKNAAFLFH